MTPLSEADVVERYARIGARFGEVVDGVTDWNAPSPVAEWRARDVVDHLITWFPPMLEGGSPLRLEPVPAAAEDPVAAWRGLDRQVRALLDDPSTATIDHVNEHTGTTAVPTMIDRFYTGDVFMHTWDLARASGQEDRLDPDLVADLLAGLGAMEEVIRSSGQFGDQQSLPEGADAQDRLIAFIGRDPHWAPPA